MDLLDWAIKVSRKRLRVSSIAVYRSMWSGYCHRLGEPAGDVQPCVPGAESAEQLYAALEGAGDYAARKRVYSLVRWIYETLQEAGMPLSNPCEELSKLFAPDVRPLHQSMSDCSWQERMIREARQTARGWKGVRLAAIVAVLCDTALRNQELIGLQLSSLTGSPPRWLVAGTAHKARQFELNASTSLALAEWLSVRPDAAPSNWLFVADATGRPMDSATLWRQLKKVTVAVAGEGTVKHFGTGLIRATKAHELKSTGAEVADIAQFLGHRQETSTDELLERIVPRLEAANARTVSPQRQLLG